MRLVTELLTGIQSLNPSSQLPPYLMPVVITEQFSLDKATVVACVKRNVVRLSNELCDIQIMLPIIDSCPLTTLDSGLQHSADEATIDWLTPYGII